ncbi:MAG: glutaminyl-peptide cyclotransferase [Actinobacteria bacterium]|nr:glutaminyl-peptide cyclotransferase [Actinomycetota bacterium]
MRTFGARAALVGCGLFAALSACGGSTAAVQIDDHASSCELHKPVKLVPQVVAKIPHQADAYTQGLLLHEGTLYESIGLYKESALRAINPATGEVLAEAALPAGAFGEGLAEGLDGELVQLTWKEETAYRWSAQSLGNLSEATPSGTFEYRGEGWGLTRLGTADFVMTDGSADVILRGTKDFSVTGRHHVYRLDGPTVGLNELEWDGESVWANRYQTDEILQIDPECWTVIGVVDMSGLHDEAVQDASAGGSKIDVVNGIAQIPGTDRFLVTGKSWPSLYEVRFVDESSGIPG